MKDLNRLRKEINRLLSIAMSNIYLKVTIEKKWCSQSFDFKSLKSSFPGQVLGSSNSQISLNFKNSSTRGLRAKLYVAFLLFLFSKEL